MRIAKISESGAVLNVAEASAVLPGWVACPEHVNIGMQITDPDPGAQISDLAAAKLEAINNGKNSALDAGFWHDGVLFDSDIKARLAYLEVEKKLREAPGYSTDWKASRGQWVTMDAALFASLQATYEAHISACFAWQGAREQEVAAALALEDEGEIRAALLAISESM